MGCNNNIFVIFYLVLNIKEVVLLNDTKLISPCDICSKCLSSTRYIQLPLYVAVLIGIFLFLTITLNIGLTYVICRIRNTKSLGGITQYTVPTTTITEYERQTSNCNSDITCLVKPNNCNGSFNKNESTFTMFNETDFEMKDLKKEEAVAPKVIEEVTNQPMHLNNKKIPVQHIISPDMMKELCTGVLKKMKRNESASLTELDKLQNECMLGEKNLITSSKYDDESLPDMEDYDVLPKPVPLNNEESNVDVEEIYHGIYDAPGQENDWISMEGYKMPKPSEGPFLNAFYMNAREPILKTD